MIIIKTGDNQMISLLSKEYKDFNSVDEIKIVEEMNSYIVDAKVSWFNYHHVCHIMFDENHKILDYHCDCSICQKDQMCQHIGAVLLKLDELTIDHLPFTYNDSLHEDIAKAKEEREKQRHLEELKELSSYSHSLIEKEKLKYDNQIQSLFQNEKYEIEPHMSFDKSVNYLVLDYRVGNEKKYVIKDLSDFLYWIDNNVYHCYGKYLSFIHNRDAFDDFALKQIKLFESAKKYYDYLEKNKEYYVYREYRLRRHVELYPALFDVFYETYEGEGEFDSFQLIDREDKLGLSIEEDEDCFKLKLVVENKDYKLHNIDVSVNNVYFTVDDGNGYFTIYRYQLDDQGKASDLIYSLCDEEMVILKDEYQDFYKYVLSPIIDYFEITTPNVLPDYYETMKLYGDVDDSDENSVYFKLYYINDNNERIPAFNDQIVTNYKQDLVEQYIRKYARVIDTNKHVAYFSLDDEKTYDFLDEGLTFLGDYCEVYVSEALKKINKKRSYSFTVGVKIENNLLELDLNSDQIPKEELGDFLNQYHRKKKFYRLKSGELLYLNSPELEELDDLMDEYHIDVKDIKDGHTSLNMQRMFSLDEDAKHQKYVKIDRQESFKKELDRFQNLSKTSYDIPSYYEPILRDYQKEGYQWLRTLYDYGFNGILADDMGLGKTLQVIALLDSMQLKKSLVVCPASLIYNWEDEVHKFTDTLSVQCVVGNQSQRENIIAQSDSQLMITSYDYMRRDVELYKDMTFDYVIVDEAQNIKNQKTKNAISVKSLKSKHRLALTGTPIENSLAELWSIFDFLMPDYLFNYHFFKKEYETAIVKENDAKKTTRLKQLVSPFILRRNKSEVLKELPDKTETTLTIPFSEEESKIYYASLAQANKDLQSLLKMDNVNQIQILALLTKLRQICCEPRILYDNIHTMSSKMQATMDLINTFRDNNQKVLLFSSFTDVLDLLEEELKMQGISYYKLVGRTSKEERRELVANYQSDDTTVFLISLKAGGTGLNLTAATAVIHYDPWWNISAQNQATDRAYRIGQNQNVQVFLMVMKDSIEEKIVTLQQKKKALADTFVENNDTSLASMTNDEIIELFSDKNL